MDKELTKKIEWVKEKLQGQEVQDLALFDVKEGQDGEDGAPYYKTYLDQTTASMGALFKKTEWGKLTPWEKLCCYKISGSAGVDCDASLRSTVIYQLAFGYGETYEVKRYKNKGEYRLEAQPQSNRLILRGDTMNSYAKTVREYIRKIWLPEHKKEMLGKKIITTTENGWEVSKKYQKISKDNYWDAAILDNYAYFENKEDKDALTRTAAHEFFRIYHTVGNFIPWPDGCNVPRGSGPVKDYWDLTLKCIHQWYQDNKNLTMPSNDALLHLFGSQMVIFHDWLASYGQGMDGWDNFVKRNFLQDFVENGKPRELWGGHFDTWEKGGFTRTAAMPTGPQFKDFFANASKWIAARGERIARAVEEALAAEKSAAAREARP